MKLNDWMSRLITVFVFLGSCCIQGVQGSWDLGGSTNSSSGGAYFIKRGNTYTVTSREALDLHERLPPHTFAVGVNPTGVFFLKAIKPFEIKGKIYGNSQQRAERILQTFLDRSGSTGALLSGEKGTGKTFLAKLVSVLAARQGIPTVVVNQKLCGEGFNAFVQSIQQPTVFLFDEFEKIFSDRESHRGGHHRFVDFETESSTFENAPQDAMLTLLDGTYPSKTLFLLTTNDLNRVSFQMRNRPGRIYYVIDFDGLSADFIEGYCMDNLDDKAMLPKVIAISSFFETFSFDVLQAMVEEMNRYGETPEQVLVYLNARPEFGRGSHYTVQELSAKGKVVPKRFLHVREWYGNPLLGIVRISYETPPDEIDDLDGVEEDYYGVANQIQFSSSHIDGMDSATGTFWYWNEEEQARLILERSARSEKQGRFSLNVDISKFLTPTRGNSTKSTTATGM